MAGCVPPRKTHLRRAAFCSFCLNTLRVILTDDHCVWRTWKIKPEKELEQDISIFFRIDDKWAVRDSDQRTTLQTGLFSDTDCGCRRQATVLFSTQKRVSHQAFWLFWFCVCGHWLLSPSYGHLASARSGWFAFGTCAVYNGKSSETPADVQLSIVRLSTLTKRKSSWRLKTH